MVEAAPVRDSGAPLRMFLVFMACWVVGRTVWSLFAPDAFPETGNSEIAQNGMRVSHAAVQLTAVSGRDPGAAAFPVTAVLLRSRSHAPLGDARRLVPKPRAEIRISTPKLLPFPASITGWTEEPGQLSPEQQETDDRLGQDPVPALISPPVKEVDGGQGRLTGYAWIVARQGSGPSRSSAPISPGGLSGAQYGASQAGLQIAYRVSGDDSRQIAATMRASTALEAGGDEELAIGGRIRPVARVPVALHAEQRFDLKSADPRGTAVYLAGGFGRQGLPAGLAIESWGQGGYIFGARETWFYDGSVSVQREVAKPGSGTLGLGASLWAGGQKGATRVDAGPRASLVTPLGGGHARVDIDWRQRVAGNARPGSGLTLTLSTGF